MAVKLKATKKKFNDHKYVRVADDPKDPSHKLWRSRGYEPVEDEGVGELVVEAEEAETEEGESQSPDSTTPNLPNLHDMTVDELNAYVKKTDLDVDLSQHNLKKDKIAAIEKAVALKE